jgi:hypothetical protein
MSGTGKRENTGAPESGLASVDGKTADRNFKGPFYILRHVRYRLKRETGVLERGLGSVGGVRRWLNPSA